MPEFELHVTVGFTVVVKARTEKAAIAKIRKRVLCATVCTSDLQDDDDIEWSMGTAEQDIDWESFKEVPKP